MSGHTVTVDLKYPKYIIMIFIFRHMLTLGTPLLCVHPNSSVGTGYGQTSIFVDKKAHMSVKNVGNDSSFESNEFIFFKKYGLNGPCCIMLCQI